MRTAEQKALEAYPKMSRISETHGVIPADNKSHCLGDANEENREAFIKGYDQAMQDLLKDANQYMYLSDEIGYAYACGCKKTMQDFFEKACEWLKDNSKKYVVCYEDGYSHYAYNSMIDDFKNYMQNEY